MKDFIQKNIKYFLLLILLYFPIFQHLDDLAIEIWDESRLAMNALEMYYNHNFLVVHFDDYPEMWSTKPPFLIWCQTLSLRIFGFNEIALRLPSAIAVFLTCILLFLFIIKKTKSFWLGAMVIITLITCNGFLLVHTGRSSNYDAMLTLFLVSGAVFFFQIIETNKTKYYYLFFLSLTLAVLTKGIAGLFFAPALLLFTIFQKNILVLLKNKHFYFGLLAFITLITAYYFGREQVNPGYLKAVMDNELSGRFLEVNEGHEGNFFSHLLLIYNEGIPRIYLLFVPLGVAFGLFEKDKMIQKISIFCLIILVTFYSTISISKTILVWYAMPLYPILAIFIAIGVFHFFRILQNINNHFLTINIYPAVFLILFFLVPYFKMCYITSGGKYSNAEENSVKISNVLREGLYKNKNINHYKIVWENRNDTHFKFYTTVLKKQKSVSVGIIMKEKVNVNDTIIVYNADIIQYLKEKFDLQKVDHIAGVDIFKVNSKN